MRRDVFIALDSGTSVIKAAAFDGNGEQIAYASFSNRYRKLPGGGAEQNLADTWQKSAAALSGVAGQISDIDRRIAAVAVTGQGDGTWLIDGKNAPVGDGLLWLDVRAADMVSEYDAHGARQKIYQFTGCGLNPCNQSAQLGWLNKNEPDRIKKADCAMHCKDWLYLNLTGVRATDFTEGVFTFGDFFHRRYAPEILDILDLSACRRLLPPMIDGTQTVHPLSVAAAKKTGLPKGTPVSLGGVDVVCSALGGGVYAPGKNVGCTIISSTGMHMRLFNDAKNMSLPRDPSGYTMVLPGFRDSVLRIQSNMSATLNIDWLARLLSESAALLNMKVSVKKSLRTLDRAAAVSNSGGIIFHPYIEAGERGPFLNVNARAQFTGLHSGAGMGQLARALYEGLAYAARHCYQAIGDIPEELRLIGGGARSPTLRQILADVLNARVMASRRRESGAFGAAMMAATAIGQFSDMPAACRAWADSQFSPPLSPNRGQRKYYNRLYSAYVLSAKKSPPVWKKIAQAQAEEDKKP